MSVHIIIIESLVHHLLSPHHSPQNQQYAQWEEAQKDYRRARSVWERLLNIGGNSRQASLWLKYAEMEMRGKYVQRLCVFCVACS